MQITKDTYNLNEIIKHLTENTLLERITIKNSMKWIKVETQEKIEHYFFDKTKTFKTACDICSVFLTESKSTLNHTDITLFMKNA